MGGGLFLKSKDELRGQFENHLSFVKMAAPPSPQMINNEPLIMEASVGGYARPYTVVLILQLVISCIEEGAMCHCWYFTIAFAIVIIVVTVSTLVDFAFTISSVLLVSLFKGQVARPLCWLH